MFHFMYLIIDKFLIYLGNINRKERLNYLYCFKYKCVQSAVSNLTYALNRDRLKKYILFIIILKTIKIP